MTDRRHLDEEVVAAAPPAAAPPPGPVLSEVPPPAGTTLGKIPTSMVDFSGAGSWGNGLTACTGYVHLALNACGITDTAARALWTLGMLTIASRESAYNAPQYQINLDDSNATGAPVADDSAHPGAPFQCSRGGWQCIPSTFADHHQAGTSYKIYDPVANCAAAVNYVIAEYGVARDGHNLASLVQQADPSRKAHGY